jgi:hypothetical protein
MNVWSTSSFTSPTARTARAVVLIGSLLAPAVAHADVILGAETSGTARRFAVTCSTCPNPVTTISSQHDGGDGSESSAVAFNGGSDARYEATASIGGPDSLPTLGTLAFADTIVDTGNFTTNFHEATAFAKGTQQYFYTGTEVGTFTIDFFLEGSILGDPLDELFGGLTVFGSGFNPGQEIQPILGSVFESVHGPDSGVPFLDVSKSGSVTFSIAPGDSFFVVSQMFATADSRDDIVGAAVVDALNTLALRFTAGDTSLLRAGLVSTGPGPAPDPATVPEPATLVLLGTGLAIASRRLRHTRRRVMGIDSMH